MRLIETAYCSRLSVVVLDTIRVKSEKEIRYERIERQYKAALERKS